ncbi:MAG: bacillithiol system redox-active protein YtxJ [Vicinamibacterales bacterium]
MTLHRLTDLDQLDAAFARSAAAPVLIFKHSPTCGISAQAHEEVASLAAETGLRAEVCLVIVQEDRRVSNEIARRLNHRHASPQVLLVQGGVLQWHASHFRVTGQAIRAALGRTQPPRPDLFHP